MLTPVTTTATVPKKTALNNRGLSIITKKCFPTTSLIMNDPRPTTKILNVPAYVVALCKSRGKELDVSTLVGMYKAVPEKHKNDVLVDGTRVYVPGVIYLHIVYAAKRHADKYAQKNELGQENALDVWQPLELPEGVEDVECSLGITRVSRFQLYRHHYTWEFNEVVKLFDLGVWVDVNEPRAGVPVSPGYTAYKDAIQTHIETGIFEATIVAHTRNNRIYTVYLSDDDLRVTIEDPEQDA